jgi:hypothetical protein
MRPDQLMTGESILQYSDNELITLTTHRIQYKNKTWGQSNFISIMLEKVSSVQVVGISYPILLVIGILIIIIGAFIANENQGRDEGGVISIAVGVIFIVAYFITKRHICIIASDGGNKIVFRTEGMNTENVINMMDKIELAKNNRVVRLAAN